MTDQATGMIPLPQPTGLSAPFWDACREGRIVVQRCVACGTHVFIPQPCCTHCQHDTLHWVECSGRGRVYSYTTVHRAPRPQFDTPYTVAVIHMQEDWYMLSNLLGCAPEQVTTDMPVVVSFRRMTDDITLPCFVRAAGDT